jgi:hypothetical protein
LFSFSSSNKNSGKAFAVLSEKKKSGATCRNNLLAKLLVTVEAYQPTVMERLQLRSMAMRACSHHRRGPHLHEPKEADPVHGGVVQGHP